LSAPKDSIEAFPGSAAARPAPAPETFRCFWHGPPLGPYEILSFKSILAWGHRVVLYRYDRTLALPDGVEAGDAQEILPAMQVMRYGARAGRGAGSYSLHANLFRYALLSRLGGWYLDTDVVMLKARPPEGPLFAAWEDDALVNVAAVRAAAGAAFLDDALEEARVLLPRAAWGDTGPKLFTAVLRRHGLLGDVRPRQAAYPLRPTEYLKFFLPEEREAIEQRAADSHFVHFWHEMMRRAGIPKMAAPPPGSWFDAQFRKHGIAFPSGETLTADFLRSLPRAY
jgi:hypothetical protein